MLIVEQFQKRLLSEPDLSLAKASEIALEMEAAAKEPLELQGNINKESEVNKINNDSKRVPKGKDDVKSKSQCYQCGGSTPGLVQMSQPRVTSGRKHAENAGN